jgi:hypothetical protein
MQSKSRGLCCRTSGVQLGTHDVNEFFPTASSIYAEHHSAAQNSAFIPDFSVIKVDFLTLSYSAYKIVDG